MKKTKVKKRAKTTTRKSKPQALSTKRTSKGNKGKNSVVGSVKPDNQLLRPSTVKGKPRNPKGKGGWKKGVSGNLKGRPKLGDTKQDNLIRKIRKVEQDEGVNTVEDFIKRSLISDTMAIALMKKLYPDLKSIEQVTLASDSMTIQEAADIRKEMRKRFETK